MVLHALGFELMLVVLSCQRFELGPHFCVLAALFFGLREVQLVALPRERLDLFARASTVIRQTAQTIALSFERADFPLGSAQLLAFCAPRVCVRTARSSEFFLEQLVMLSEILRSNLERGLLAQLVVHGSVLDPELFILGFERSELPVLALDLILKFAVLVPRACELDKSGMQLRSVGA